MKLYRHYKNKPYKVHGIAKHSETLEDLVVYETLYDNPTARLWVRPREMFEGDVTIDGREIPRFAKVPLKIEAFDRIDGDRERILLSLVNETLGNNDPERLRSRLKDRSHVRLFLAFVDDKPVAFKLGYELDKENYYSWLGGVLPDYRRLGIAEDLMNAQHDWCRAQGFRRVRMKTRNRWKAMLLLAIKNGYDIVGYTPKENDEPRIELEKTL